MGQYPVGILAVQFVLSSARQIDISLLLPWLLASEEGSTVELLLVGLADIVAAGTQFKHILNLLCIESRRIVDVTIGSTDGDDLCTEFCCLLGCAPCHIAEAREGHSLTFDV